MAGKKNENASDVDTGLHWHSFDLDEVLSGLGAPRQGLSSEEVQKRLDRFGPNELKEKPRATFFQLVLAQLNNFIVILLIVASVISALLGDWIEAGVVMLIVVLNAILGVVQESRAEEALAALKKMAAPESQVLRDGQRVTVPFLQPIFNTHFLAGREWLVVLGLGLPPAVAEEFTKLYLRMKDAGQKAQQARPG
jgi:Ca2+-transporting ATPase